MKTKILNLMSLLGEAGTLVAAIWWLIQPVGAAWCMILSAAFFCVGRVSGPQGDYAHSMDFTHASLALRRLYRQRMAGAFCLLLAAVLMHLRPGLYLLGIYLRTSSWILPFVLFAVFETYTAFRIPAEEKKLKI